MKRKQWMALSLVLVSAMAAGIATHGYSIQPRPKGADGTEVRHLVSCGSEVSPGTPWRVERLSRQGDDLIVRAAVVASCGPLTASQPLSRIQDALVSLTWEWHVPSDAWVAACTCQYRLEFRVPGAAGVQDPTVELKIREGS